MPRSPAELEELVRVLETVWIEQSERAHVFQQEASSLWRAQAEQDRTIAELRREIEALRLGQSPIASSTSSAAPQARPRREPPIDDAALRHRIARQREAIEKRKHALTGS